MRRLVLFAFVAASASAQGSLPAHDVRAAVDRLRAADLLADSTAEAVATCAESGVPLSRSALVGRVKDHVCTRSGLPGCGTPFAGMIGMARIDSLASWPPVAWVDSLVAVGLLSDRERQSIGPVVEEAFDADLPPPFAFHQLGLIERLLQARELVSPEALAARADEWSAVGVLTDAGRERMLAAARAGDIAFLHDAFLYADVTERAGVEVRDANAALGVSAYARILRTGAALLRRRGVLDLDVRDVALDRIEIVWADPYEAAAGGRVRTVEALVAHVDGRTLHQRRGGGRPGAAVSLLNQVLRDRGRAERLFQFVATDEGGAAELALAVLTPEQYLVVVGARDSETLSPRVLALLEATSRFDEGTFCGQLGAAQAFTLLAFGTLELDGPEWTDDESALTHEAVDRTLDGLEAAGLLDSLTDVQRAAVRRSVHSRYLRSRRDLVERVPHVVLQFDWDRAYPPQPYAQFVRDLATITRGGFAPTDFVDTFAPEADSVTVAFTEDGRRFETTLPVSDEWLSRDVLDLVVEAVSDDAGAFYRLGQYVGAGLMYLTPDQVTTLQDLRLLSPDAVPLALEE